MGIRKSLLECVEPLGFVCNKQTYYRVQNDVVQGFVLKRKCTIGGVWYSIGFATFPLCNPHALFYQLEFDRRNICYLNPSLSLWPFYQKRDGECEKEICKCLRDTLIPYFGRYSTCRSASLGLPELRGHGGTYDITFFALKVGDRDSAIRSLSAMLAQREEARRVNERELPERLYHQLEVQSHAEDAHTNELLNFIKRSSDDLICDYLAKNEEAGRKFLADTGTVLLSGKRRRQGDGSFVSTKQRESNKADPKE